jgi:hypothetical protein
MPRKALQRVIKQAINMQIGIRHELMQLHAINKEKPTKKFVDRKG